MSTQENLFNGNLQSLSDTDLHHHKNQIDAELRRRALETERVDRMFQSFSHLNQQELAKLKEKIANHLEQSLASLSAPPTFQDYEPTSSEKQPAPINHVLTAQLQQESSQLAPSSVPADEALYHFTTETLLSADETTFSPQPEMAAVETIPPALADFTGG